MNLMKTRLIPVLLALALIFSLAGCGASSAPSAPAEITSSPSSVQEAPASSEAASPVDSGPAEESADDGVIRATEEELDLSRSESRSLSGAETRSMQRWLWLTRSAWWNPMPRA